ncbi:MAG TPA: hypothetical protein VG603_14455 [Chitinophagales bacterium]|nr:hypothetical protein [Chitinophagales bacterium]
MELTFQNNMPFEFTATEYCSVMYEGQEYNIVVDIMGGSGSEEGAEMDIHILEHGLGDEETERINELVIQKFSRYTLARSFAA